ncbi:pilus assembly protein [Streptomyces sp. SID13666]|uniref:TadE family protein n=1 Tax=Streptomyces TaxID=1883 RepID=UPI0011065967|nr:MULTISPECIES: TadE family protein [Streptomyces]MCZ4101529.1 pilus assembly protein [Streptomyces sp. H39-C1]NEA54547.1 pilus assembly protein [Streptomyces sp. SID13666]NEA74382.1 pilus assembly protein [Streptomyces sp. SID13588]QNA73933.1 pilus assembly protein [Streptomyces sp. So13.3]
MSSRSGSFVRRRLDAARGDSGVGSRTGSGGDRGMTAIEFVFLTPVLFFMIFATVQFGLFYFADHVAQAAAQAGARKARAEADGNPGGWEAKARSTALSYIAQLGPNLLEGPTVTSSGPANNTVGIRVTATVPTVFPGMTFTVNEQSQGPIERFVPDIGG